MRSIAFSTGPGRISTSAAPLTPDAQQRFSTSGFTWFFSQHVATLLPPSAAVPG